MKNFFKKIFSVFKKAWFWWLLALLVTSAIVWFALPLLKFGSAAPFASKAVRLAILLILVIAWAIINIILAKRAKKDDEDSKVDPEKIRRALELLRHNFSKASKIVAQGSWSKKYTKQHAYSLPWYITLGAPQSGRSSLLRHSGLPYPVANESYQQIEHAEDELCQFWFSKHAVFIDSHQDLFTNLNKESVPQRVWTELLTLLKQYRRKQPLNGVLLCIDLHELIQMNEKQRADRVHLLRSQLQTLNNRLGIQCPIYVCFTKSDLVAGFSEYFSNLPEEDKQQSYGFTLPYKPNKDSIEHFATEYDVLVQRLHDQLIQRFQVDTEPRVAALINNYPTQMQMMRETLQSFLVDVFEANHYQQSHAVRGVFFTSSLQQGIPFDCLEGASNKTFGVEVVNEEKNKGIGSMFINGLFEHIVFPEKDILLFNQLQSKRQQIWLYSSYVITGLVILTSAYLWTNSYLLNKEALTHVNQSVQDFKDIPASVKQKNSRLIDVLPVLNELREMSSAYELETDPRAMHWGLYQGRKIDSLAEKIYQEKLSQYFLPFVVQVVEAELNNPNAKANQTYNALRVYLMLANPDKMKEDFMLNWLQSYWGVQYSQQPAVLSSLVANLAEFVKMNIKPITPNNNLVAKARYALRDTTQAQRDYFELQELAEISNSGRLYISNGLNVDFNSVFGKEAAQLSVPALYTFKGYNGIYKKELQNVLENADYSNWVLGEQAQKSLSDTNDIAEIAEQVRNYYMRDYIAHWNVVIDGLKVQRFDNLKQASNTLNLLSGENSPVLSVLSIIKTNTELNPAAAKSGSALAGAGQFLKQNKRLVRAVQPKSVKKVTGKARRLKPKGGKKSSSSVSDIENPNLQTPVGVQFASLNKILQQSGSGEKEAKSPYNDIQKALSKLSEYVAEINLSANKNERAYQAVLKRMSGDDAEDPINQLIEQANAAPTPVKVWLQEIARNTWAALLASARDYISTQYVNELYPDYQKFVKGRFPFNAQAKQEIEISEFTDFFQSDGRFEKFFKKYLAPFIDTERVKWAMKEIDGRTLPISADLLQQLQRAANIKAAFFPGDENTPKESYSLQVNSLSASLKIADMQLNGDRLLYQHGPKRTISFAWPKLGGQNLYTLQIISVNNGVTEFKAQGVWGLFRLFQQGSLTMNTRSNDVNMRFSRGRSSVNYTIKSDGVINPFQPDLLSRFRLPATLESK